MVLSFPSRWRRVKQGREEVVLQLQFFSHLTIKRHLL